MHRKSIRHNFEDRTDPIRLCSACREAPTPDLLLNAKDANHPWYLIKELPVPFFVNSWSILFPVYSLLSDWCKWRMQKMQIHLCCLIKELIVPSLKGGAGSFYFLHTPFRRGPATKRHWLTSDSFSWHVLASAHKMRLLFCRPASQCQCMHISTKELVYEHLPHSTYSHFHFFQYTRILAIQPFRTQRFAFRVFALQPWKWHLLQQFGAF